MEPLTKMPNVEGVFTRQKRRTTLRLIQWAIELDARVLEGSDSPFPLELLLQGS